MPAVDIVVTTVFEPAWLAGYLDNLRAYGHDATTTIRVVVDRKTPPSVAAAAEAARRDGFAVDCPTLDEQAAYLAGLGLADDFIPWDTDNRRNIGFLRAWEAGTEVLVSIDDDNHCRPDADFVARHAVVGSSTPGRGGGDVADGGPWFNICSLLTGDRVEGTHPRGFPYAARGGAGEALVRPATDDDAGRVIAVNAGLWLDDPDVDAVTRLARRPRVTAAPGGPVVLGPGTWSPLNTQNTALVREALPAYYYVRMGHGLRGLVIDRFGDILSGYFLQACLADQGHAVRIGDPVADHRRSPHDLFVDLYHELAGMVVVEDLVTWLRELRLPATGYADAYAALADELDAAAGSFRGFVWDDGGREFLTATASCMRTWLGALDRLAG